MPVSRRPRLALVIDAPNWAFDGIARAIRPTLERTFDVELLYLCDYEPAWASTPTPGTAADLFHELFCGAYDAVHLTTRVLGLRVIDPVLKADPSLRPAASVLDRVLRRPITMNVHDHMIVDQPTERETARNEFALTSGYFVSSGILAGLLRDQPDLPAPRAVIVDGVDASAFRPAPASRLRESDRPLRVGWAGNADWGIYVGYTDHKGVRSIIEPALARAAAEGLPVEPVIHDRARNGWLPRQDVVSLIESLDIYTCASLHEGTATSALEAMACGLPLVATRVGILPDVVGPLQGTLLVDRTVEAFVAAIRRLAADPELRVAVGAENRRIAESLTWERCGEQWRRFFEEVVAEARQRTGAMSDGAVWERHKAWSRRVERLFPQPS